MNEINSPHFKTALEFANDLISGKKIANVEQVQACQRFLDDLQRDDLDFKSNQFDFAIDLIQGTIYPEKGETISGAIRKYYYFCLENQVRQHLLQV